MIGYGCTVLRMVRMVLLNLTTAGLITQRVVCSTFFLTVFWLFLPVFLPFFAIGVHFFILATYASFQCYVMILDLLFSYLECLLSKGRSLQEEATRAIVF